MIKMYRALKNFEYPESLEVRNKIRSFHKIARNEGVSYQGDRGKQVEVDAGAEILLVPDDLLESWLDAGLVEEAL